MFTGIIETIGVVQTVENHGSNTIFWISSSISSALKVDQSVSHNGVCLTVEAISGNVHRVTAIEETIKKTDLATWETGKQINLERCLQMNGRLDGHIVQGHVDTTGICTERKDLDGSWEYTFQFPEKYASLIIEKGSISLNGISLTVFNITDDTFTVAIIPFTHKHTNLQQVKKGSTVNIEFDMIGKYVNRLANLQQS